MSKWKNFCKSVSQLTEKALKKTEELTDVAALHVKIKALEAKINEQYENLGALTYAKLKGGAENADEASDIVAKIDGYLTEIAAHKLRLAKMEEEKEAAKRAKAEAEEAKANADAEEPSEEKSE